jgi:hypothetical protein
MESHCIVATCDINRIYTVTTISPRLLLVIINIIIVVHTCPALYTVSALSQLRRYQSQQLPGSAHGECLLSDNVG